MKKLYKLIPVATLVMPFMALAQGGNPLLEFIEKILQAANLLIPLFMILAVAVFLWGIVKYILASGDPEKEKTARGYIIYGLIGMFVLVALFGILRLIANMIGAQIGQQTVIPGVTIPPAPQAR